MELICSVPALIQQIMRGNFLTTQDERDLDGVIG